MGEPATVRDNENPCTGDLRGRPGRIAGYLGPASQEALAGIRGASSVMTPCRRN
jgi:hypothetical protein